MGRYLKHSVLNSSEAYLTVFKAPSTAAYSEYIVAAAASGYVEIDDWNRQNLVVFASSTTGFEFASGRFGGITNGVKVVVADDPARVHAFPFNTSSIVGRSCERCGRLVPYERSDA